MLKNFNMMSCFASFEVMQRGHHLILKNIYTFKIFNYPHINLIYDYIKEEEEPLFRIMA